MKQLHTREEAASWGFSLPLTCEHTPYTKDEAWMLRNATEQLDKGNRPYVLVGVPGGTLIYIKGEKGAR